MISSRARAAGIGSLVWLVVLGALLSIWTHEPVTRAPELTLVPVQIVEAVPASPIVPALTQPSTRAALPLRPVQPTQPVSPAPRTLTHAPRRAAPFAPPSPREPASPTAPSLTAQTPDTEHASPSDAPSQPDAPSRAPGTVQTPSANADTGPPSTSAHAVYQPLPELPDDARDEAFTAVALARFIVHPDGQCDVSLIEATRNPTLNRLLLASLRQWRFAPATEHGHTIETTVDLRVHFNVH